MRGMGMGRPVAIVPLGWWIAGRVLALVWRFVAGQVVLRRPGKYDARYLTWAVDPPGNEVMTRAGGIPRTRWARRPGWHRQVVRLGAIAFAVGMWRAPVFTVVVTVAAIAFVVIRRALDARERAYYYRTCGRFLEWTQRRIGWGDVDPDPRKWIHLPSYTWTWEPIAPLRAAVLRTDDKAAPDGWLRRFSPKCADLLAPLTLPIAEWRWVRSLIEPPAGRPRAVAIAFRWIGCGIVHMGEASRRVRVWPRSIAPDLANDDAEIVIEYPAHYQAHGEDLKEVERVVTTRMPGGSWKFRHNPDDLTVTLYHPATLPRYVEWDCSVFERYSQLELPIGVRAGDQVIVIDLKGQTPHVNASGKTGRGKTVTVLVIIGGFLYHGGHTVIVDPKRVDFVRPFKRLPNVDLVTVPERFPHVLHDIDDELSRRYEIMERFTEKADELGLPPMEKNAELYFQPLQLVVDEKSGFTAECIEWWKREGGPEGKPGKGLPITVTYERNIVARGRACGIYAVCAAQQNSLPHVFPDTDIRSNYQYKISAGPADGPSWVVTFPGERRRTLSSNVKGRAIVGMGSDLVESQLANMDPSEVRKAAEHGLEIRDKLNLERAERLAAISGRPLWEVSPLPWWVAPPAETGQDVQGHQVEGDTASPTVIDMAPVPLSITPVISDDSAGQDDEAIENEIMNGGTVTPITAGVNVDTAENHDSNTSSEMGGPARAVVTITGNRAAAEHLGVSFDAFRKARQRAESAGETIPGMEREGRRVTFDAVQLAEWWNQRPGSGRKAS